MKASTTMVPNSAQSLTHLTINTGNVAICPDDTRDFAAIRRMRNAVRAGRGQVLSSRWSMQMFQGPVAGSCGFELHYDTAWPVSCYMAWTEEGSQSMWAIVQEIGRGMKLNERLLGAPPKSTPWLSVLFMPDIHQMPPWALFQAGGVEQLIAWTALDLFASNAQSAA